MVLLAIGTIENQFQPVVLPKIGYNGSCTGCNVPFVYPTLLSYEGAGFVGSVTHGVH